MWQVKLKYLEEIKRLHDVKVSYSLQNHSKLQERTSSFCFHMSGAWKLPFCLNKSKAQQTENSTLLGSPRKGRHRTNHCPQNGTVHRQIQTELWLTWAEMHQQKPRQEPVPPEENLNCNWRLAGGSVWTILRLKTPGAPSHGGLWQLCEI